VLSTGRFFRLALEQEMNWVTRLLGIAIAIAGVQQASAKSRLTDPLKIARECKSEAELLCKGVRPGGQRLIVCLKQRMFELSPACSAALMSAG
jgi:hypothetical protein